jgi:hypothetical protein
MGMGLAICHNIVLELGGQIAAENPTDGGKGALLRVTLPAAPPSLPVASGTSSPHGVARRARVLVIDDEAAVASAMARMLRKEHDVMVETDGRKVAALLASGAEFDVIFCDLMMPGMTGMDLFEAVA